MYGASANVVVKDVVAGHRILLEWSGGGEPTEVEFNLLPWGDDATYVEVTESGFTGSADEIVAAVTNSAGGFSFMLSALKALLEHDIVLRVVLDGHSNDVVR
jgi:uncharacterized protein YndB with AHSA1/START domain